MDADRQVQVEVAAGLIGVVRHGFELGFGAPLGEGVELGYVRVVVAVM